MRETFGYKAVQDFPEVGVLSDPGTLPNLAGEAHRLMKGLERFS